jgi:guanylate kinase
VPSKNPPKLSSSERIKNGLLAVKARKERALAKSKIANLELSIFDLINSSSPAIKRMKVVELLEATPGVGSRRAFLIMSKANISPSRRIAGLGKHQIQSLKEELVLNKMTPTRGVLVVMSGPGGVGKSTISAKLNQRSDFWVSVSMTTRAPREGEVEGRDYFFVTEDKFDKLIAKGEFLEWAEFAGNRYGTPKQEVFSKLDSGINVLLEIEIAGARSIRKANLGALFIFIAPPSWEELQERLISRGTDTPERRAARLALAEEEMAASGEFDEILVNLDVNQVVEALVSLATEQKGKSS